MDFLNQVFEKAREIDTAELEKEHGEDRQEESWAEQQIAIDQTCAINTEVPNDASNTTADAKMILGRTNVAENLRYKSGLELSKSEKKTRNFSYCKTEGQDSRTCEQTKADQLAASNANGGNKSPHLSLIDHLLVICLKN
ncbi:hypothetical protein MKX01_011232 [Papaver californicum]|nr:hypothetical protein MKX01_011232 [Papaver californicum]